MNTAGFPCSNISSNSSFVVVLPAANSMYSSSSIFQNITHFLHKMFVFTVSYKISYYFHLFIWTSIILTDFQLTLYPPFATLPVVRLRAVIFGHYFDKFTAESRMLCFTNPEICIRFITLLLLLDILFYHCTLKNSIKIRTTSLFIIKYSAYISNNFYGKFVNIFVTSPESRKMMRVKVNN